jgi:hypothetical protein
MAKREGPAPPDAGRDVGLVDTDPGLARHREGLVNGTFFHILSSGEVQGFNPES